jgi:hypothetical protein
MKLKGLDGKDYDFNIVPYINKSPNPSKYHKRARQVLYDVFPFDSIAEEVPLSGSKIQGSNKQLRTDFMIPSQKLMVEVHGEQHYSYNAHFYNNKLEFYKAKTRDNEKRRWAEINGFILIELKYSESDDDWRIRIQNRR